MASWRTMVLLSVHEALTSGTRVRAIAQALTMRSLMVILFPSLASALSSCNSVRARSISMTIVTEKWGMFCLLLRVRSAMARRIRDGCISCPGTVVGTVSGARSTVGAVAGAVGFVWV